MSEHEISQPMARELARQVDELEEECAILRDALTKIGEIVAPTPADDKDALARAQAIAADALKEANKPAALPFKKLKDVQG